MLLECQNCGASLDVRSQVPIVRCNYCGMPNQVGSARTVAPQTPPGWRPPPVWTPPQHFPALSQPIRYSRTTTRAPLVLAAVGSMIALAMAGGVFFMLSGDGASPARRPGAPFAGKLVGKAAAWDGKSTLDCGLGETLVIENRTVTLDHGPVVHASMSCKLTIRGCTFRAPKIVEADQSAHIVIENSRLVGAQSVVTGSQVVEVRVEKNSTLESNETAIDVSQSSQVYLVDSSVESKAVAINAGQLSRIDASNSKIIGETSIKTGQLAKLVLRKTHVTGKRELGSDTDVDER